MLVTTSAKADLKMNQLAREIALELKAKFVLRERFRISKLMKAHKEVDVLLVTENGLKYIYPDGTPLFFHPNLARVRITSALKGHKDRLSRVSGVQNGDIVLDCTTGLATDAIVLSFAAGETGKVTTIESEPIPYILAKEGLRSYDPGIKELETAMRRITVVHADHLDYLRKLPDISVDVIYFDPMFRKAAKTVALAPLRSIANHSPLQIESITEAKRVARKTIVFREHLDSGEFERLGFRLPDHKAGTKFEYGVIRL